MRTLFISLSIALGILAILFEGSILPSGFIPSTPGTDYTVNLISLTITLGGVFLALRLSKKEKEERTNIGDNAEKQHIAYLKWNGRRIGIIFSVAFTNLIIYYGGTFNESAMYNLIITLIGAIFCWPHKE